MTKKVDRYDDWVSASVAAQILADKCGVPVRPAYITKLSRSKKQPVRTRAVSGHLLYNREDIMRCVVNKRVKEGKND
jgi:hypothetical protein